MVGIPPACENSPPSVASLFGGIAGSFLVSLRHALGSKLRDKLLTCGKLDRAGMDQGSSTIHTKA